MNKQQLLDKVIDLERKFADPANPADLARFQAMRKRLEDLMLYDSIKDSEAIKEIRAHCRDEMVSICRKLLNARDIADIERARLFDRKDLYEWFLGLFGDITKELEQIEKELDDELAHYKENFERSSLN